MANLSLRGRLQHSLLKAYHVQLQRTSTRAQDMLQAFEGVRTVQNGGGKLSGLFQMPRVTTQKREIDAAFWAQGRSFVHTHAGLLMNKSRQQTAISQRMGLPAILAATLKGCGPTAGETAITNVSVAKATIASGSNLACFIRGAGHPSLRPPSSFASQAAVSSKRHLYSGGQAGFRRQFGSGSEVVWGLLLANVAVFGAWQVFDPRFMQANFTVSGAHLESGRWHTVLTSGFSHKELNHLLLNMLALYFFGTAIAQQFGGPYLLGLYLSGAVVASLSHVVYYRRILPELERRRGRLYARHLDYPALGASGAVNAIVLLYCLLYPTQIIMVNFFIPVPAVLLGAGFILKDLYGATRSQGEIAHAGHLGGALVGLAAWLLHFLRRM